MIAALCRTIFIFFAAAEDSSFLSNIRQVPRSPPAGPLDYSKGGEDWTWGACKLRNRQSPVNIDLKADDPPVDTLKFRYQALKTGMTLHDDMMISFPDGYTGGFVYEGNYYNLYSAALHTESEHTVFGKHSILELQLYHKRPNSDATVVVSFLLQPPPVIPVNKTIMSDAQSKTTLDELLALGETAPGFSRPMMHFVQPEKTGDFNALNFNDFFLGSSFWEYQGSLTRPPCSETATWFVRRGFVSLSPRQAQLVYSNIRKKLKDKAPSNNRILMPLGERSFRVFQAEPGIDLTGQRAPSVDDFVPVGPNPRGDRLARLNGYAQAAINKATEADEDSQMLDYRIQSAAWRYAKELTPELTMKIPEPTPPKFDAYAYQKQDPVINQVKVAESMSKAVAQMAANNLKTAADTIVAKARKGAYEVARIAFEKAADAATTTLPPPWMTPPPPLKLSDGTVIVFR
jgi:carbonic anhydrase